MRTLESGDVVDGTELLSDVFRGQNSVQTSEKGFCPKENLRTDKNVRHFYQRISKIIFEKYKRVR